MNWYTKGNTKRCKWNPPNSCCCLVFIFDKFYFNVINIIFIHNFISASFLWNPKYVPHSWMLMNYLPLFWQDSYLEKRILPLNSIHQDTYFEFVFNIFLENKTYPKMKQFSFSMNMNASSFWKKSVFSFVIISVVIFFSNTALQQHDLGFRIHFENFYIPNF